VTERPERVLVLIPAYNEAPRVGGVIAGIRAVLPAATIVVVDDGSADDTTRAAREAGATVVRLPFNLGAGAARQVGFRYARAHGFRTVVILDGDGQHEPADAPLLLEELRRGEADMILGSRFLGAGDYRTPALRALGMGMIKSLIKLTTGQVVTDPTSGYQALGPRALALFAGPGYPSDYADAEVLIMTRRAGLRLREAPVRMYQRSGGQSMFTGLRPAWYMFKMLLSVLVTMLRPAERVEGGES